MTAETETPAFVVDVWVTIPDERTGFVYRVTGPLAKDGSVPLYGGDKNPRGRRGSRSVMPGRLRLTTHPYGDHR